MRSRTHVSLLSLHYPPEPTGNAPYIGALARGLASRDLAINAHVAHPHYPEWAIRAGYGKWTDMRSADGVMVVRRRHYVPRPPRGMRRLVSELTFGTRLFFGRWGRPDAVIAASPALFATAIAALRVRLSLRRPALIVWVQDLYSLGLRETGEGGRLTARVTRWVESAVVKAADRVVAIHPRFAEYIVNELKADRSSVQVIRNWTHVAPPTEIDPTSCRDRLGWPRDAALVVHTGNMGAKQGLENVIEAARLADERQSIVRFILVGEGGERAALEARAAGIERVDFVDPLDENDYILALAAADILLVQERAGVASMAVPSKLTSYFNAGRPIIAATDPTGITASEIAASAAGVVVPPTDPVALLAAAEALHLDTTARDQFSKAGRLYREAVLSEETALSAFEHLLDDALTSRSRHRR